MSWDGKKKRLTTEASNSWIEDLEEDWARGGEKVIVASHNSDYLSFSGKTS